MWKDSKYSYCPGLTVVTNQHPSSALDIKGDNIVEWQPQIQAATMPEYVPVAPNTAPFLASTQRSTPVLAGSTTAPAVHTEPPTDCPLLWSGMDMPLQHRETLFPYQVSESAEDSPFYSSPGPSASPLSDGVTLSMSPYPQPSVSPAPTMAIEPYPEDILKTDTAPSPLQAHNGLRSWGSSDLSMSMVPATLDGVIIQPVSDLN